jgi:hypothetical protein
MNGENASSVIDFPSELLEGQSWLWLKKTQRKPSGEGIRS